MSSEHEAAPLSHQEPVRGSAPDRAHDTRTAVRYSLKGVVSRRFNPVMQAMAGRRYLPLFAVVSHRGRRSGRAYETPVSARPTAEGFVIPLTFGDGADWFRNARAAGGCVIRWKGAEYPVIEPEIVDWATARAAFHPIERVLVPLIGIDQFVRLRHAPAHERDTALAARTAAPAQARPYHSLS